MEENNNVVNTSTTEKEGSKFGWGVLGFFIPLVGLILFLVWMKDKKRASKAAGIGALIGFIFSIISTVLLITFFGAVLGIGLFEYDNYKDNYNKTPIVEENTIIPGICGKKVNINKSYKNMKLNGYYSDKFYIYDYNIPNIINKYPYIMSIIN